MQSSPGLVTLVHQLVNVGVRCDRELREVFDVRPEQRVLPHPEVASVLRVEEVAHALAVNLHVADLDRVLWREMESIVKLRSIKLYLTAEYFSVLQKGLP